MGKPFDVKDIMTVVFTDDILATGYVLTNWTTQVDKP